MSKNIPILYDSFFKEVSDKIINDPDFLMMKKYTAHGKYTVYDHSIQVALLAYSYAKYKKKKVDYQSLIRGSLLHDFYLYDWHDKHGGHKLHGFRHPLFALKNASKKFNLNKIEKNMIKAHMFPLTFYLLPRYRESFILQYIDKVCALHEMRHKFQDMKAKFLSFFLRTEK